MLVLERKLERVKWNGHRLVACIENGVAHTAVREIDHQVLDRAQSVPGEVADLLADEAAKPRWQGDDGQRRRRQRALGARDGRGERQSQSE
jgi:hypothetical protein